jgi:hypothetical protein
MIYDLQNNQDVFSFKARVDYLLEKKSRVELKNKTKRSLSQNNYLHLILSLFAMEYGESLEYVKQTMFKKWVNPEIFKTEYINRKTGEVREDWKSSRDITTSEMATSIDRFRDWSSKEAGIYLPEANEHEFLKQVEKDIHRYKQYL